MKKLTELDRLARLVVRAAESLDVDGPHLTLIFGRDGWEAQLSFDELPQDMVSDLDGVSFCGGTAERATKLLIAKLGETKRLRDIQRETEAR